MWTPTHVHVVVKRAENLLLKGKNKTNNAFVVIELGKESYRTSVKENSSDSVVWNEECELKIPKIGNTAAINLTALHRNSMGLDQFLGTVKIPLTSFDKYQKTIQWYRLQGKPGKEKGKDKLRGELEVQIGFISKLQSQSLTSLQSKKKMSFEKLTASLFSLRNSDKKFDVKKIANTLGRNVLKKKKKNLESMEELEETETTFCNDRSASKSCNNLDPGVISDEDDSGSHKSSESLNRSISSSVSTITPKSGHAFLKNPEISVSQWEDNTSKLISSLNVSQINVNSKPKLQDFRSRLADRRLSISCVDLTHFQSPKPEKKFSSSMQLVSNQGGSPKNKKSKFTKKLKNFHLADKKDGKKLASSFYGDNTLEKEIVPKSEFKNKNKEELINMVVDLQKRVNCVSVRVKDLEDYLDDILLKVMDTVPKILEKS